ncbi:MAG: DUF1223 domain-containing protein [Roseovarius sp.]
MRQVAASIFAGLLSLWAVQAEAEERPVVVELFTSQGCASCPPADAYFLDLAAREDVIALSLHVDYWDYIGWEDSFGSPDNSARQRGYAKAGERKMVYTPQMIINGADHVVGTRFEDVEALIARHRAEGQNGITVEVMRDEARVRIAARAEPARAMPLLVQLVRYIPEETVAIEHGENAGRTITYVNIVTEMTPLAVWDSREPLDLDFSLAREDKAIVLLQYVDFGTIEAVAHLR